MIASHPALPDPLRAELLDRATRTGGDPALARALAANPSTTSTHLHTLLDSGTGMSQVAATLRAAANPTSGHLRKVLDRFCSSEATRWQVHLLLDWVPDPDGVLLDQLMSLPDVSSRATALSRTRTRQAALALAQVLPTTDPGCPWGPVTPPQTWVPHGQTVTDAADALVWFAATHPEHTFAIHQVAPHLVPSSFSHQTTRRGTLGWVASPTTNPDDVISWANSIGTDAWVALAARHPDPTGNLMAAAVAHATTPPLDPDEEDSGEEWGRPNMALLTALANRPYPLTAEQQVEVVSQLVLAEEVAEAWPLYSQLLTDGPVGFIHAALERETTLASLTPLLARTDVTAGLISQIVGMLPDLLPDTGQPRALWAVWAATHPNTDEATRHEATRLLDSELAADRGEGLDPNVWRALVSTPTSQDLVQGGFSVPVPALRHPWVATVPGVRSRVDAALGQWLPELPVEQVPTLVGLADQFTGTLGQLITTVDTIHT